MDALIRTIDDLFRNTFGGSPLMVRSPGRVNLIGEHTDYNKGFVLPAAIDRSIVFAMAPNKKRVVRLLANDMEQPFFQADLSTITRHPDLQWPNYVLGVLDQLNCAGHRIEGFDCAFGGNLPIGAGLSSSAALEGGILYGLNTLFDLQLDRMEMARIGQRAENDFVGMQCGIMDQFANLHGKEGHVMKLDCRSMAFEQVPFPQQGYCLLLCDSGVRRELAGSEYNKRREQCAEGIRVLQRGAPKITTLRDVPDMLLMIYEDVMDPAVYRRCRYVLDENQRVVKATDALRQGDLDEFGELMFASHEGLRDLYEVSCPELDLLVDSAKRTDGVLGARMMGGGFGGCTINLVEVAHLDRVKETLARAYASGMDREAEMHVVTIGSGTHLLMGDPPAAELWPSF